jgi:uncharacterized protein YgbK (DUF1537 family)
VKRWTILADDLTGAADAAVAFASSAATFVHIDGATEWPARDVLSVNTESRHVAPQVAAGLVEQATRRALGRHDTRLFKKIDSQLRGNVAPEVAAMLGVVSSVQRSPLAVVAPAYPANRRTLVAGRLHIDGAAAISGDEIALAERFRNVGLRPVLVAPDSFDGSDSLARLLGSIRDDGFSVAILDAQTDDHLGVVAGAVEATQEFSIPVGSGGLAMRLAAHSGSPLDVPLAIEPADTGILFVVGSYSDAARAQVNALVSTGVKHVTLDHASVSRNDTVSALQLALAGGSAVLSPDPAEAVDDSRFTNVAEALAAICAGAIGDTTPLVVVGGATLRSVLDRLGVHELQVIGEFAPGVIVSRIPATERTLVSKAGAFGADSALVSILDRLSPLRPPLSGQQ